MIASIRELRASTKEIMSAVQRGDTVVITNRGKPYAKIVPIKEKSEVRKDSPAFGMWKDHKKVKSVKQYIDNVRKGRNAR